MKVSPQEDYPHVLVLTSNDPDEDDRYEIIHPDRCSLWIEYKKMVEVSRRVECEVTMEIDAVGIDSLLQDLETGRYHFWHRFETINGPDWTEYDTHWEIVQVDE